MTYSIVAFDRESGQVGAAVATGWPAVGSVVPWVEPGAGAVATQAFTNIELGPMGLALLREGLSAHEVLERLLESDPRRDLRQLGLVDLSGRAAAATGDGCVAEAGHLAATGVSVQANTAEHASVWPAMLAAFERGQGDLAERLLAALFAGEHEGGDIRGCRSAALVVAPSAADERPWTRHYDLRVDGSSTPLEDLAQALTAERAYGDLSAAITAARSEDLELALEQASRALELVPDDLQIALWHALLLMAAGREDEARPLLHEVLRAEPRLAEFARRFAASERGTPLAEILLRVG